MPTVQQVLAASDGASACDLLFTVSGEVAEGKDLSSVVADIAQGVLNSKWSVQVKRLAYDLCKAVPLSDADSRCIIAGVRGDVESGEPEVAAQALAFLPNLQPHLLANLLTTGELARLVSLPLGSDFPIVRRAAVNALGASLLVPAVLSAAASSAGLANQVAESWQALTDALLDDDGGVVGAALAACSALLRAGLDADGRLPEGFLLERLSAITAARVSSALGAVLSAASTVPAPARVELLRLLQLIVDHTARAGGWEPLDVGGLMGLPSGTILPGLPSLAPSVWGMCADLLRSGQPAARLEAARAALHVAAVTTGRSLPGRAGSGAPSFAEMSGASQHPPGPASVPIPIPLLLDALNCLLDLEDGLPLVEAAAEDIVGAAIGGLAALPHSTRLLVMAKLWQALARVKLTPARVKLFAQAWVVLLPGTQPGQRSTDDLAAAAAGLLDDSYLKGVLSGSLHVVPAPASATGLYGSAASGGALAGAASAIGSVVAAAAAALTTPGRAQSITEKALPPPPPAPPPPPKVATPAPAAAASTHELLSSAAGAEPATKAKSKGLFGGLFRSKDSSGSKGKDLASISKENSLATAGSLKPALSKSNSQAARGAAVEPPPPPVPAAAATSAVNAAAAAAAAYQAALVSTQAALDSGKQPGIPASGALRHELLATLLAVLHSHHPAAALAAQLCGDVAAATAADQDAHTALGSKYAHWQQSQVLAWVATVRGTLQATQGCLHWEPVVVPGITHRINAAAASKPPADLSTTVVDAWLQLLQAASAAARAVGALQAHTQQTLPGVADLVSKPSAAQSGVDGGSLVSHPSAGSAADGATPKSSTGQATLLGSPLALAASFETRELSTIVKQVLREWPGLSRAARPRALWVACHSLDMAPHADEQWELGLRALQDSLCKLGPSGAAGRVTDLVLSAGTGVLLHSGRLGWPRDRPFVFDVVAASALCERHEYEASALVVGLAAAQAWATRLQDALAVTTPESAKRVSTDVVFQAARLDAVLREFMGGPEIPGSPVLREWAKRTLRAIASTAVFVHPAVRAEEEAERAAKEAEEAAEKAAAKEAAGLADDDSSGPASSSSSSYAGGGDLLPVSLPTAMYLPPGAARPRPAMAPPAVPGMLRTAHSTDAPNDSGLPANGFATGVAAQPTTGDPRQDVARDQETFKTRAPQQHGSLPAHMVASAGRAHPWGYPFSSAPRISNLFHSKRGRRSRILAAHVTGALRVLQADQGSGGAQPGPPPALPSQSVLRLDSPAFWAALPGEGGSDTGAAQATYAELCGPGDPVMLLAAVSKTPEAGALLLSLTAINRTDVDVRSAVVAISARGPVLVDRRAIAWTVPRLAPHDRTTQTFTLRLLGYGEVRLHALLQLVVVGSGAAVSNPVQLQGAPFSLGLVRHLLLPPLTPPPARDFFATWAALAARTELTAVCVWPGREGAAAAVSAALRSPLVPCMLTYTPATTGYQAALAGETSSGEVVLILIHTQLAPGAAPANAREQPDLAGAAAAGKGKGKAAASSRASATGAAGGLDANDGPSPAVTPGQRKKHPAALSVNGEVEGGKPGAGAAAVVEEAVDGPADAPRGPAALLHIAVRSSLPDVTMAVSAAPAAFLSDLVEGAALLPGASVSGAALLAASGPRPPLHPKIVALDAAHTHSVRALPPSAQALLGAPATAGVPGESGPTTLGPGLDVYAQGVKAGSKVSHKWMEAAAMAEWQRLVAQPV